MTKELISLYKQQMRNDLLSLEIYVHHASFEKACFLIERMIVSSKAYSDDALNMSLKKLLMEVELHEWVVAKHHLYSILRK